MQSLKKAEQTALSDDAIAWKRFPHYWPLEKEIHQSPVGAVRKGSTMQSFNPVCPNMSLNKQ